MNVTCKCIVAVALFLVVESCSVNFSSSGNGTSVGRTNDQLTVGIGNGPVTEGSGKLAEEKRPVAAFRDVVVEHGIQVLIEDTSGESLSIKANDNLLPLIETSVEKEVLHVRVTGSLKTRNPIRVSVATQQLSKLTATNGAGITAAKLSGLLGHVQADSSGEVSIDDVQAEKIELAATSSGMVTAKNVAGKMLRVTATSSGRVTAAGNVDEQHVEVSSAANYDGGKLVTRLTRVDCNSSGSALVQATEEVAGSASSAGSVRYIGEPGKVSVTSPKRLITVFWRQETKGHFGSRLTPRSLGL